MKIHLGVIDVPYAHADNDKPRAASTVIETTGEVAEILEAKYHIMQHFVDMHGEEIARDLEDALGGAMESLLMGSPIQVEPFGSGLSKMEERFKNFLSQREMDDLVPGVPTRAAKLGINHRFKHPYARRGPRPSFIDTGLFQSSMRAWIE